MSWKGKLIGFLIGLVTRRVQFMVLGLLLGHLYDMGVFSGSPTPAGPPPAPPTPDPYAVLGVSSSASNDEIEQAYRRRMSEYHPDRVASAAKEIRELAGQRAGEINGAYEEIKRHRGL
jgi:DnaJ-domain-containing protein 1